MIIGSISGVSPTATDSAKSSAWVQFCFVSADIKKKMTKP